MLLQQREKISLCQCSSETGTDITTRVHPVAFNTTEANKRLRDESLDEERCKDISKRSAGRMVTSGSSVNQIISGAIKGMQTGGKKGKKTSNLGRMRGGKEKRSASVSPLSLLLSGGVTSVM